MKGLNRGNNIECFSRVRSLPRPAYRRHQENGRSQFMDHGPAHPYVVCTGFQMIAVDITLLYNMSISLTALNDVVFRSPRM